MLWTVLVPARLAAAGGAWAAVALDAEWIPWRPLAVATAWVLWATVRGQRRRADANDRARLIRALAATRQSAGPLEYRLLPCDPELGPAARSGG